MPRLGIDLQGGTTVTLTPRSADGKAPTSSQLHQAQEIIDSRVNGRGISGAEVVIAGSNIQITIPGDDQGLARSLGATAQLFIRPVKSSRAAILPPAPPAKPAPDKHPSHPAPHKKPGQTPSRHAPARGAAGPVPTPSPVGPHQPAPPVSHPPKASPSAPRPRDPQQEKQRQLDQGYNEEQIRAIAEAKKTRQTTDSALQAKTYSHYTCPTEDPIRGNDDPALPLITCSADKTTVYLLEPSIIRGTDISDASNQYDGQTGQWIVSLSFKGEGARVWPEYTAKHIHTQTAFTLDSQVLSAPEIQSAIGSVTQVTGNFTSTTSAELANQLKYGGLPLSFDIGTAQTISATLGIASLQAGLLAGVIGIIIVLIFSSAYYRTLGALVAISLGLSLVLIYVVFVLLGRTMGLTLDLPGIAGIIIGIGMTADSFVVYFERIKDEVRTGRSVRSAVNSGWDKAQKTIFSGNLVSLIAALILYIFAVGAVRGFAFTLGLTSILDLIILYFVTHPIMELVSTMPRLTGKPALLGLGKAFETGKQQAQQNITSLREHKPSRTPRGKGHRK